MALNGTIALPEGFRYVELAAAGAVMDDGRTLPGAHDGMTCFAGAGGTLVLLRNDELSSSDALVDDARFYDGLGAGGVTVTVFDPASEKVVKSYAALLGTIENCNGGTSLSGSWLTCEETTDGIGAGHTQPHGYVFEVPATTQSLIEVPLPLKAMGRFEHEAARQDATNGVVYMTEDNGDPADGFYRFVPLDKTDLSLGGQLQMLAVKGRPQLVLYKGQSVGAEYQTKWVDIADPDPVEAEAARSLAKGQVIRLRPEHQADRPESRGRRGPPGTGQVLRRQRVLGRVLLALDRWPGLTSSTTPPPPSPPAPPAWPKPAP